MVNCITVAQIYLSSGATTYVRGVTYASNDAISQLLMGSSGAPVATVGPTFEPYRQQPTQVTATPSASPALTLNYWYCAGQAGSCATNNGNVLYAGVVTPSVNLLQSFGYDQFGNRALLAGTQYYYIPGGTWTPQVPADSAAQVAALFPQNRWSAGSVQYDGGAASGSGNMTALPGYTFAYDAENRMVTANQASSASTGYVYDGDGRRVQKVSCPTGTSVCTASVNGATVTDTYVYGAAGELIAEYAAQPPATPCTTCYLTEDTLGSARMMTDGTGTLKSLHDYLPFGEEIQAGVGARTISYYPASSFAINDGTAQKFTGKERDGETGLDHFDARYYSAAQGRWTIPDWSARQEAVPYATIADPQTLNLYAYVRNNPLSRPDLDGHCPADNPNCNDLKPNPLDAASKEAHEKINESVEATKTDDKEGKPREHGGQTGRDANGNEVVVPAKPGPAGDVKKSKELTIDTSQAADPSQQGKIKGQPEIDWHTHPGATASALGTNAKGNLEVQTRGFMQSPSPDDIAGASAKLNLVIGVRVDTLYVYDSGGTKCQVSLSDFNKQP